MCSLGLDTLSCCCPLALHQPGSHYQTYSGHGFSIMIPPSHYLLIDPPGISIVFNTKEVTTNCEVQTLASGFLLGERSFSVLRQSR